MKRSVFLLLPAFLLPAACDGVYDTSVQGVVVDWDDYNSAAVEDPGINDVDVYLYLDETLLDEDLTAWGNDGTLPDGRLNKKGVKEQAYYQKTTTAASGGENGVFNFNGLMWRNFFPEFGNDGDRATLYFLFYHKDYGMVKADNPVIATSGVTNKLPQFRIKKALCEVILSGYVVDMNKKKEGSGGKLPLQGVTVGIYMPVEFNSSTVLTDADGRFEQKINFTKRNEPVNQKCTVKLTFELDGYVGYTLTSEAANQYSGLSVTAVPDVERDSANWVLLNGSESVSLSYKGFDGTTASVQDISESVGGGDGPDFTEKYDIDNDGEDEVCLPVTLTCNTDSPNGSSYRLGESVYLKQYRFSTTVAGSILDSTGATLNGSVTLSSAADYSNSETTKTQLISSGDTPVYEYSMSYSWTVYNYSTEYAYQLVYMKASAGSSAIDKGATLISGRSENAVDFTKN